jgi:hypothetical protein
MVILTFRYTLPVHLSCGQRRRPGTRAQPAAVGRRVESHRRSPRRRPARGGSAGVLQAGGDAVDREQQEPFQALAVLLRAAQGGKGA